MSNKSFFLILFLILSGLPALYGSKTERTISQDSLDRQLLYNGRIWRNLYARVGGYPFLFTQEFLPGTVTIGGKTYENIKIRYDIYNDELLIITDRIIILQVNKEMVDGFTVLYAGVYYTFKKLEENDQSPVSGYVNVVYEKTGSIYVKYRKEIDVSGSDNANGVFFQFHKIFIKKDGIIHQISSRNEFLKLLADKKDEVKDFLKTNKIKVAKMNPWSYGQILQFYDSLK